MPLKKYYEILAHESDQHIIANTIQYISECNEFHVFDSFNKYVKNSLYVIPDSDFKNIILNINSNKFYYKHRMLDIIWDNVSFYYIDNSTNIDNKYYYNLIRDRFYGYSFYISFLQNILHHISHNCTEVKAIEYCKHLSIKTYDVNSIYNELFGAYSDHTSNSKIVMLIDLLTESEKYDLLCYLLNHSLGTYLHYLTDALCSSSFREYVNNDIIKHGDDSKLYVSLRKAIFINGHTFFQLKNLLSLFSYEENSIKTMDFLFNKALNESWDLLIAMGVFYDKKKILSKITNYSYWTAYFFKLYGNDPKVKNLAPFI